MSSPDYSSISKRAKTVKVKYRNRGHGVAVHLVVDATGLKVYGEGEWKTRKHGKEKRRTWRKLHLAVDAATHEVVAAEMSLINVGDNEVLPTLLNPLRRRMSRSLPMGLMTRKRATNCCSESRQSQPFHPDLMPNTGRKVIQETKPWQP